MKRKKEKGKRKRGGGKRKASGGKRKRRRRKRRETGISYSTERKIAEKEKGKSAGTERFFEGKGEEGLCAGIETRGEIGQLKRGKYCKVF